MAIHVFIDLVYCSIIVREVFSGGSGDSSNRAERTGVLVVLSFSYRELFGDRVLGA